MMARELKPCGTNAAYARHVEAGEQPCEACKEAHAAYNRARYRVMSGPAYYPAARRTGCGSPNGYQRHRRRREDVCPECQAARAEYQRAWRAGRKAVAA